MKKYLNYLSIAIFLLNILLGLLAVPISYVIAMITYSLGLWYSKTSMYPDAISDIMPIVQVGIPILISLFGIIIAIFLLFKTLDKSRRYLAIAGLVLNAGALLFAIASIFTAYLMLGVL